MNHQNNPYTRLESDVVAPDAQSAPIAGGRINGFLEATQIRQEALKGAENYDVFKVLVPFWQLQLYYQLAGAARNAPILTLDDPTPEFDTVDYANYFGIVAETMRQSELDDLSPGELQLHFVRSVCDAVQEDLTDFFIRTGFLRPIDRIIDDYGERQFLITQAQIDETINYIKNKEYRAPVSPVLHYISAHSLGAFRDRLPLTGTSGQGVSVSNPQQLTIDMDFWPNAVAFETYDEQGALAHIAIAGTGDPSLEFSQIKADVETDTVFAVGFDGQRIQVYPEMTTGGETLLVEKQAIKIFPNPILQGERLDIDIPSGSGLYKVSLLSASGRHILTMDGNENELKDAVNTVIHQQPAGMYFMQISDPNQRVYRAQVVKQ